MMWKIVIENNKFFSLDPTIFSLKDIFFVKKNDIILSPNIYFYEKSVHHERGIFSDKYNFVAKDFF